MLKSTDGWDQVAAFIALTMRHKMETAQATNSHRHPAPNARPRQPPPPMFAVSNSATEEEDDPG